MVTRRLLSGLAALIVAAAVPAWAGAPTEQMRRYTDEVIKILEDPSLKVQRAERQAAVRKLAEEVFDTSETSKRALGRHWQSLTPAQREEFTALFADLLDFTYLSKLDRYGGERVRYVGESVDGDFAVVRARIIRKQGAEVPVEARLLRRGERWLVYDVAIEGVSLVSNYRSQFDQIIRTSSYDELVRRLKTRREEFVGEKPKPSS